MQKTQVLNLIFKILFSLQFQKIVGMALFILMILFIMRIQIILAGSQLTASQNLCQSYYQKADLVQDWSETEARAFYTAVLTFTRLENKSDPNSLESKADLQAQLTQFQTRKSYTPLQRSYFTQIFQEQVQHYKHLTQAAAELDAKRLMAEHHVRVRHVKNVQRDLNVYLEKMRILKKYQAENANEALINIFEDPRVLSFAELKFLLKVGANINYADENGLTALHYAAAAGLTKIVKFLIQKKAVIDALNHELETPLLKASYNGHTEIVKFLIQQGAQWDHADKYGNTALTFAIKHGQIDFLKFLISKDKNLDFHKDIYTRAFYSAIRLKNIFNKVEIVKFFIQSGVKLNSILDGQTPLSHAILNNSKEMVQLLLAAKANTNIKTHHSTVELLILKNLGVNTQLEGGLTPFNLAIALEFPVIVQAFLEAKIDESMTPEEMDFSFRLAKKNNFIHKILLDHAKEKKRKATP